MKRTLGIALGTLLLLPVSTAAQNARPISAADFIVAGLTHSMDSVEVRRRLGSPASVSITEDPFDVGGTWTNWYYRNLRIQFVAPDGIAGFWLLTPRLATARGIRLGSTRGAVRRAYGTPGLANDVAPEDSWVYLDPGSDLHLVKFFFENDRVVKVFIGYASD